MDRHELLERYEALGDERDFLEARASYEQAEPGARTFLEHGYLLECHGRNEIRRAAALYEQAIALDPDADEPHYHLISALAALFDVGDAISAYERRLAASPDVRSHYFLAQAYLAAHRYEDAADVVACGLALRPDDRTLIAQRGEARAGAGDVEAALADWRRAIELGPENIGPLFSTAFLLERIGRFDEAIAAWESIVGWHVERGDDLHVGWPRRELERLRAAVR